MDEALLQAILQGLALLIKEHPEELLAVASKFIDLFDKHPNMVDLMSKLVDKLKS